MRARYSRDTILMPGLRPKQEGERGQFSRTLTDGPLRPGLDVAGYHAVPADGPAGPRDALLLPSGAGPGGLRWEGAAGGASRPCSKVSSIPAPHRTAPHCPLQGGSRDNSLSQSTDGSTLAGHAQQQHTTADITDLAPPSGFPDRVGPRPSPGTAIHVLSSPKEYDHGHRLLGPCPTCLALKVYGA